ncbi:phytase [Echinicola jeungdonensis]|uniref:Phytase n=1 Tax=Echinicola jeungdonensis TaxID=709343 RepID=A0ABV5J9A7_9BACT|nr:phytase [Echinicola jeungdonensis]MDN3670486.1 phytase [Echinicola jeungdonensis]
MRNFLQTLTGALMALVQVSACQAPANNDKAIYTEEVVQPVYVTGKVKHDSDDPAIWVNKSNPAKSLVIGTDKDKDGALYVFDLKGNIIDSLMAKGIQRPNNVDVGYGLKLGDSLVDFAVTGERLTSKLRFYSLPDMKEIHKGGIEIFKGEKGEEYRDLMGIALYHDSKSGKHYVIAGRKNGPTDGTYLWQYEIQNKDGKLSLDLVRKFGQFSGKKEIEAIAVDQKLGYVYYSDEGVGVRKYHAQPEKGNEELALFAQEGFTKDHEGISIYELDSLTGYILVSDQEANQFHVFPREGSENNPHQHKLLTKIKTRTLSSDGSELVSVKLDSTFTKGLFVAMSDDKTFQYYKWEDMAADTLKTIK